MSNISGETDFTGIDSSISLSIESHRISGNMSSPFTLDSYPDQEIYSGVLPRENSTSGSASSEQSFQGVPKTQMDFSGEEEVIQYLLADQLTGDSCLVTDFSFDLVFEEICATSLEDVYVIPRSMKTFLRSRHTTILPMITDMCQQGDFVYAGHALMMTLKIPFAAKYPPSLVCDVCIFSQTEPVLLLTIISDNQQLFDSNYYNTQLARAVITATRKEIAEFSVIHGVILQEHFSSKLTFQENIKRIKAESYVGTTSGSMLMSEAKFKDVVRVFLQMMCVCQHVRRLPETTFSNTLYFTQHIFLVLCELLEERRQIAVETSSMNTAMCIIKEMTSRFCSVMKAKIFVECSHIHVPHTLENLGKNVKIIEKEDLKGKGSADSSDGHIVLTTSCTGLAKWDFIIAQDKEYGGENEQRELARAKRIIAASILEKAKGERVLTQEEKKQLENMMYFNLEQFERRTETFFEGNLKDDKPLNDIEPLNRFMEDYLMQCFRQRYIQLSTPHEIDQEADRHVDSVRKLSPLLAGELKLEQSNLLDRLIQNDVMSEAGRQSIMARSTHHTRNKAFITYLCGNFTSESFKGQFLPLLAEDHHHLAKRLEDEMDRLTVSSKRKEQCAFCKMKDIVNIRRLADALYQMNAISESLQKDLSASAIPNTVKWSELFKHVKSMETIMRALELKNEHLYKEFVLKRQSCMECTCDNSEKLSVIAGSEGGKAEDDVANLDDFSE